MGLQIRRIRICEKVMESIGFEIGFEIRHIPTDIQCNNLLKYKKL